MPGPPCRGLVDIGAALPFDLPFVTLGTDGAVGLFRLPFLRGVVGGFGVVPVLPELFKLIGLRNLSNGFVDLLDDSVVVCRGTVTVSPPSKSSVYGVSSVTRVVVVNSLASFS